MGIILLDYKPAELTGSYYEQNETSNKPQGCGSGKTPSLAKRVCTMNTLDVFQAFNSAP